MVSALADERLGLAGALALIDTGPRLDAFIPDGLAGRLVLAAVLGPLLWRARTDGLIRRALSAGFSRPATRSRGRSWTTRGP